MAVLCQLLRLLLTTSLYVTIRTQVHACGENGTVRLVDGVVNGTGRLEICVNGLWGTVCNDGLTENDGFDIDAARVVCRQLGYPPEGVITSILFGGGASTQPVHLDDVQCTGTESTLLDCPRSASVDQGCRNHDQDVGIICQRSQDCRDGSVRLVDGDNYNATVGRVEYCVGGLWGTVCNYRWGTADATVVCRQLGLNTFPGDQNYKVLTDVPQVRDLRTPIVLDGLNCRSNENRLDECQHLYVVEQCTHSDDSGANCTVIIECKDGDVRLVQSEGDAENEGRVEYCSGGRWVVVCHDSWDNNDARVICRQLGFNVENQNVLATDVISGSVHLEEEINCVGTESDIDECPREVDSTCLNIGAGVICPNAIAVASLLLVVYADGVDYAELTTSVIQSRILRYERLLNTTEDTKIRGLDYHFSRKELYLTQNNHCITRVPVILDETTMLSSLRKAADPEVLFNRSADLGSVAVDWVNNELYWVEIQLGYRIMRAIINSDGSVVGPFCVVSFTMGTVTHLAIDPNRGYLYWSGSTAIYRAPLTSVRLNSTLESCASDISSKAPFINNTQLETFTIEPNDAIYYVGYDPCFETGLVAARRTNRSILGTPLNAGAVRVYTGVAGSGPVVSTDSFDRTLFSATDDLILVVDTSMVATCPAFPDIGVLQVRAPLLSLRTFRSVKQPLPGTCGEDGSVRLVDGAHANEGRLEVCISGQWGTVCNDGPTEDDGFDIDAARVVCRQLGIPEDDVITNISFGEGSSSRPVHLDDVQCTGTESTLLDCTHSATVDSGCRSHREDIGIICQRSQDCRDGSVRLVDGDNYNATAGRVEYCVGGRWGTVCNFEWTVPDATVVCRQLGLPSIDPMALTQNVPGVRNYQTPIVLDGLKCRGSEANLGGCEHLPVVEYCTHSDDAGADCSVFKECNDTDVRLVQLPGDMENEGRVEYCSGGRWGLVCFDFWDTNDARVICRQLGYDVENRSVAVTDRDVGHFTQIALTRVDCIGTEDNINKCPKASSGFCRNPGAGVICFECTDREVRLRGGDLSDRIGGIEVCMAGRWGLVCDDHWDDTDATVVCRQLGYTGGVAITNSILHKTDDESGFFILDDVNCTGNESNIFDCPRALRTDCTVSLREEAGVICGEGTDGRCTEDLLNDTIAVRGSNFTNLTAGSIGICHNYLGQSNLCNSFLGSTDYVFTTMDQLMLSTGLDERILPLLEGVNRECSDLISRLLCHYFFSPCGANGQLHLPLAVCQEECHYVQSTCETQWRIVNSLLSIGGLSSINCSATGAILQRLDLCCIDAGIKIERPPPVQTFCSIVVWSNPQLPCDDITGYEVRLYNPDSGKEVTRSVDSYSTYYTIKDKDKLQVELENAYVQVRVLHKLLGARKWSDGITLGCELTPTPKGVHFVHRGRVYLNNSAILLRLIGENENALLCKTDLEDCCGTRPNRFGEFYYPNGVQVPIKSRGHGFYRDRGEQEVRLHRREGVTTPTGRFRCQVPDAREDPQSIYIELLP